MRRCVLVAFAAAMCVSGCGSDKPTLTHAQFVKRANANCRSASKALRRGHEPKTPAQFEHSVNRSGFIVQRLYDNLTALDPPKADAGRYAEFLKVVEADIRSVHGVESAVAHRKFARLAGLQNGRINGTQRETRMARALGIGSCAGVTNIDVPKPPKPRTTTASAGTTPQYKVPNGVPFDKFWRSEFVAGCSTTAPHKACVCLFDQLTRRYRVRTVDEMVSLSDQAARALVSRQRSDIPPKLLQSALACQSLFTFH